MATTRTTRQPAVEPIALGRNMAVGAAAGIAVGLLANIARKALVQSPTIASGSWDKALATEHRMALAIFDLLERTTDRQTARRTVLFTQLKHALGKHALQEENAIYTMMRDFGLKEAADHLNHDHGYVKQYLFDLTELSRGDPAWLPRLREFRGLIERHVREEEDELFPSMRAKLSDAQNRHLTVMMNREGLKLA